MILESSKRQGPRRICGLLAAAVAESPGVYSDTKIKGEDVKLRFITPAITEAVGWFA